MSFWLKITSMTKSEHFSRLKSIGWNQSLYTNDSMWVPVRNLAYNPIRQHDAFTVILRIMVKRKLTDAFSFSISWVTAPLRRTEASSCIWWVEKNFLKYIFSAVAFWAGRIPTFCKLRVAFEFGSIWRGNAPALAQMCMQCTLLPLCQIAIKEKFLSAQQIMRMNALFAFGGVFSPEPVHFLPKRLALHSEGCAGSPDVCALAPLEYALAPCTESLVSSSTRSTHLWRRDDLLLVILIPGDAPAQLHNESRIKVSGASMACVLAPRLVQSCEEGRYSKMMSCHLKPFCFTPGAGFNLDSSRFVHCLHFH